MLGKSQLPAPNQIKSGSKLLQPTSYIYVLEEKKNPSLSNIPFNFIDVHNSNHFEESND